MAKVVQKAAAPAATREPSDMEVLHPERVLVLGGESVMVREYGNVEWPALPVAEPLVAAITAYWLANRSPAMKSHWMPLQGTRTVLFR
jgi:hypothetical protein